MNVDEFFIMDVDEFFTVGSCKNAFKWIDLDELNGIIHVI